MTARIPVYRLLDREGDSVENETIGGWAERSKVVPKHTGGTTTCTGISLQGAGDPCTGHKGQPTPDVDMEGLTNGRIRKEYACETTTEVNGGRRRGALERFLGTLQRKGKGTCRQGGSKKRENGTARKFSRGKG